MTRDRPNNAYQESFVKHVDVSTSFQELLNYNATYNNNLANIKHTIQGFSELTSIDDNTIRDMIDSSYTGFAIVLNTDFCNNGGIHWVCLYVDLQ